MNQHSHARTATRKSPGFARVGICAAVLAGIPGAALADLYTWIDERGTTVISNVMPRNPRKVKNFEVVMKEDPKQAASKSAVEAHERALTERLLLDRIESLEREMRSQQARDRATVAASAFEPQNVPAQDYTADSFYPGHAGYYPSYVFPHPPGFFWGYPPSTVVIGSSFGAPYRGGRNFRSFPPGRAAGHSLSIPVSVPVSVPVSRSAGVWVKR